MRFSSTPSVLRRLLQSLSSDAESSADWILLQLDMPRGYLDFSTKKDVVQRLLLGMISVLLLAALTVAGLLVWRDFRGSTVASGSEFVCTSRLGYSCRRADLVNGPPKKMILPHKPSIEDRQLIRTVLENKAKREEMRSRMNDTDAIAFLFLSKGKMPLWPFWQRFFKGYDGQYNVYVNADDLPKDNILQQHHIHSEPIVWGSASVIDAQRRLLAMALADPRNSRFVLLSDSCVPLHSFRTIKRYLRSTVNSFVESFPDSHLEYSPGMGPEVPQPDFMGGSFWWALTRPHAYLMLEDQLVYKKMAKFCRFDRWHRFCQPDLHYAQTVLHLADKTGLERRSLTYEDWSMSKLEPKMFGPFDIVPHVIANLKESNRYMDRLSKDKMKPCLVGKKKRTCYLFLRRVHPEALQSLLLLSNKVLGF